MHESSIARQVLRAALDHARAAGAQHVRAVRGWVAETEALSADSVGFHFEVHARGTPAEGARLELIVRRIAARCASCGCVYEPDHHILLCPSCGAQGGELLGTPGLGLESIDVE